MYGDCVEFENPNIPNAEKGMALSKRNEVPFADLSIIEFVEELHERFKCLVCKKPLCDPVQTECGHRLCYGCFQVILR